MKILLVLFCIYGIYLLSKEDDEYTSIVSEAPIFADSSIHETIDTVILGSTKVYIRSLGTNDSSYILLNLHEDERTSQEAAKNYIREHGGRFIYLHAQGQRNITFRLNDVSYTFDPNRIFTDTGVERSLKKLGAFSTEAKAVVVSFGKRILSLLTHGVPVKAFAKQVTRIIAANASFIIAVHNNTNGNLSIHSYRNEYSSDAADVSSNDSLDPDDFFLTTDSTMFNCLKAQRMNIVLQANEAAGDDGSLSVFCGKNNLPYLNIEAEIGHFDTQLNMLIQAIQCIHDK